jgi:hypothetical protein
MQKINAMMHWLLGLALVLGLAGCAAPDEMAPLAGMGSRSAALEPGQAPLQCVPYARDHSDVKIFGDAWTWWDQGRGKYPEGSEPLNGSVMVLSGYAGPQRGHVAVVRQIVSPREIRVDHANWLDDGSIYLNDPVQDVSRWNDWTLVRVFNIKTGAWGSKTYPVQGFIGGTPDNQDAPSNDGRPDLLALADIDE